MAYLLFDRISIRLSSIHRLREGECVVKMHRQVLVAKAIEGLVSEAVFFSERLPGRSWAAPAIWPSFIKFFRVFRLNLRCVFVPFAIIALEICCHDGGQNFISVMCCGRFSLSWAGPMC